MITSLTGTLLEAQPTRIVVGVNGVGYELFIPLSSFDRLPEKGERVTILTHLHVKDDSMVLYGFATEDERELFRLLLGVSRIGPKGALGVLSGISPGNFRAAVSGGDAKLLASVPGIGRKKAERLIVELRDKIDALEAKAGGERPEVSPAAYDATLALVSLGYRQTQAARAVRAAVARIGARCGVETLVREALKELQER